MRVELRPSCAADFVVLLGDLPEWRSRTITALADGKVIGIGGLVYTPDGRVWASVLMKSEGRRFRVAIHRAGLMAMRMIEASGARRVYAAAEAGDTAAEGWLLRLGFRLEKGVFVWVRERC